GKQVSRFASLTSRSLNSVFPSMSRASPAAPFSTSLGMTGTERRNAGSTLQRRILASVGDTHVQRRISKEGSRNALGPVARRVLREGTARPRFSGNSRACERRRQASGHHAPEKCVPDDEPLSLHGWTPDG